MHIEYDEAADLDDLYQQMILDHSRSPRNFGAMDDATGSSVGHNPLCGDRLTVFAKVRGDRVEDVRFTGKGCAICVASASLMTEAIKGRSPVAAQALFDQFHQLLTRPNDDTPAALDKLIVFEGVRKYPIRVKCATLPWHTMKAALEAPDRTVSTE